MFTQTKSDKELDDFFNPKNAVKTNRMSFGKEGDFIKGTLTEVRVIDDQFSQVPNAKVHVYEIMVDVAKFHVLDDKKNVVEPAIEPEKGEFYVIFGKKTIDDQMRKIKLGQVVGLRFMELKASKNKGFNPAKIIRVFPGPMNEEWQGQTSADAVPGEF